MFVKLLVESKVKDEAILSFFAEYKKRLSPYFDFILEEIGDKDIEKYYSKLQAREIADTLFITLDVGGKTFDTFSFAKWFEAKRELSKNIVFIVGGASGLSKNALSLSSQSISLSALTFSYRVSLVVLAEQIYRAMTIILGHPYHK